MSGYRRIPDVVQRGREGRQMTQSRPSTYSRLQPKGDVGRVGRTFTARPFSHTGQLPMWCGMGFILQKPGLLVNSLYPDCPSTGAHSSRSCRKKAGATGPSRCSLKKPGKGASTPFRVSSAAYFFGPPPRPRPPPGPPESPVPPWTVISRSSLLLPPSGSVVSLATEAVLVISPRLPLART